MADRPPPHDTPAGPNPDVRNLSVEVLSDNWYTLRLATFEHRQPDGSWAVEQREAYDRGNGVVALLHDPERDTVLLVRQYRAPAHLNGHPDGMVLEAPAGLLDGDERAEDAMRRELEEEVGHDVTDLRRVFRLYMSPGSVTEHLTFFTGTYTASAGSGGGGVADEGEQIDIVEVTVDDAVAMVADGRIVDAKTVILVQQLQLDRR
jgi:nudix-type nucleoside diphosphatase (YffH/AdpP family)